MMSLPTPRTTFRHAGLLALLAAVMIVSIPLAFGPAVGAQDEPGGDGKTTILLMGGDAGPQRIGLRTDSMMVASIDRETGRAALFGVPRNLVNTPLPEPYASLFVCGCWESLLNELYYFAESNPDLFGGPNSGGEVMMRTIEHLLGLDIDYYALVDLPGFVRVIDAIGGVTIDVPVTETVLISPAIESDGWQQYVIPAGRQHLDGRTALAYARTREGSGDYERMARQRCIVGALAREADVQTLLINYPAIVEQVEDSLVTNVPLERLPDLIEILGRLDFGALYTLGFTTGDYMAGYDGQPYYPIPSRDLISQAVDTVFQAPAETVAGNYGTLPGSCSWQ
jgi:polyisoprenyl-teichoic acid--peptidoglycan teichoic acid transferase